MDQVASDKRVVVGISGEGVFVHEDVSCLAKDRSNWATGRPLPLRADLAGFGYQLDPESAFAWGYSGGGPRILAASLICDLTGSEELARDMHVALAFGFVAFLKDRNFFKSTYEQVALEIAACVDDRENGRPMFGAPFATLPGPGSWSRRP